MEAYPYNRRNNLSSKSQLNDFRNQVSVLKKGQSDRDGPPPVPTDSTLPSPTMVYRHTSNANDTVRHRRPRLEARRPRESVPTVTVINEISEPTNREGLGFNDRRRDPDLWLEEEIELPERVPARRRNTLRDEETTPRRQSDIRTTEAEWYEENIGERLRRLERFEKAKHEATAARGFHTIMEDKKQRGQAWHKDDIEEREKIKQEIRDEEARRVFDEQKRREHEAAIRYAAVEDYKTLEKQRRDDEEQQRKQIEREIRAQIEVELGQSLEQVKAIIYKAKAEKSNGAEERLM
ncbi:hypothetical protein N7533_002656 [Penicillium manginii]|uniref:uncharacterized protein n=1 Tax=Penicillium manginii TaxID=203109 RepID=UPI0025498B7E|nr:uncharacterized protein N7533_002656 [Penicillium manginii]KAJ5763975.1 hypothetical protein N7533_002656 [Penicillium manginii]